MVVQKYIKVADNKPAHLSVKQEGDFDLLEMHFPLAGGNRRYVYVLYLL